MTDGFALFIDGAYLASLSKGRFIDFRILRSWFESHLSGQMVEGYYFDADDGDRVKFHSYLQRNVGIRVKNYWSSSHTLTWPTHMGGQQVVHPETGKPFVLVRQKAVDVALGFYLSNSWHNRKWKKLVLVAGDGDFSVPVKSLVEGMGVQLILVGETNSMSPHLISYASEVFNIGDMASPLSGLLNMRRPKRKKTKEMESSQ